MASARKRLSRDGYHPAQMTAQRTTETPLPFEPPPARPGGDVGAGCGRKRQEFIAQALIAPFKSVGRAPKRRFGERPRQHRFTPRDFRPQLAIVCEMDGECSLLLGEP